MKEMLGNLADGQIEFYKAVRTYFSNDHSDGVLILTTTLPVHGRMGTYYTYHPAHTCGCVRSEGGLVFMPYGLQ